MRGGGGGGFRGGGGGGGMVRGGWGGGGGGIARGGWGGGVVRGGWGGGVVRGGWGNGFRGGFRGGFRSGFFGPRRSFIGVGFGGWPWWGGGWGGWGGGWGGWGPSYVSDIGWDPGYYGGDPGYYGGGYPASYSAGYPQQSSPNVTVVYPPQAPASNTVVLDRSGGSVTREYDQYGQEINRQPAAVTDSGPQGPQVFLIAFRDHTIRAAAAYWVEGAVLHYVTLEHEQKTAPLNQVDRDLCVRLNRERRVVFSLPAQ